MIKTILFSLLLLAPVAAAQTEPIRITKTSSHVPTGECNPYERCFSVEFENLTENVITGVELDITFIDIMGDRHTYAHHFLATYRGSLTAAPVKPGKKKTAVFNNVLYPDCRTYEVKVLKVAFKDGTVWQSN